MSDFGRVLLVGATGLVGRAILTRSIDLPKIRLQALARREIPLPRGARMELVLADAEDWPAIIATLQPDAVICALGTTRTKAGSREAFRAVDHDLVMDVANAAKANEATHFVMVSAAGADAASRNFYLRTKGETEEAVRALKFSRLDILRPGLLRGRRAGDRRPLESLAQLAAPIVDPFLRGGRARYRSIPTETVAKAALQGASAKARGSFVHANDGIARLARDLDRRMASTPHSG
ncbi:NAD-dependent epimerase/dehydratase family protein [Aurantiacibacter spongiae]|uniref:NAD-dependent epimerase/dehydratase family protein n=2 Tax=Aurantiacibacter spongiae TaxID=2488860 RepID=A0A3N5CVN1_9SPHN|nr:NAD-dependent epimerase/dehydratase family protein [Aurantiacibacter spongiae]